MSLPYHYSAERSVASCPHPASMSIPLRILGVQLILNSFFRTLQNATTALLLLAFPSHSQILVPGTLTLVGIILKFRKFPINYYLLYQGLSNFLASSSKALASLFSGGFFSLLYIAPICIGVIFLPHSRPGPQYHLPYDTNISSPSSISLNAVTSA